MKVKLLLRGTEPVSLESFMEKYKLTLVVRELARSAYQAKFEGVYLRSGSMITPLIGDAIGPEEAVVDLMLKARGAKLQRGSYMAAVGEVVQFTGPGAWCEDSFPDFDWDVEYTG